MFIKVKKTYLFFLFFSCFYISCSQKYKINYELINDFENKQYDSVQPVKINFKETIDIASEYINKFNLSDDENQIIGFWREASWLLLPSQQTDDIGIYSFLPNRKYIQSFYSEDDKVVIKYGNWKVSNGKLQIQHIITVLLENNEIVDFLKVSNPSYDNIFTLEKFEIYPINLKPFKNEKIPRYRQFHDFINYGPDIYNPVTETGNILFNPIDSKDYIYALLTMEHFYFY